jgi:two-component system OmpR family sensor kinase
VTSFAVSSDGLTRATSTLPVDLPTGFSTLRPEGADSDFRVLLAPFVRRGGVVVAGDAQLAVGVPLDDVEETLGRLRRIEAAVGAAVLGSVGLLAWWLVRVGLRPLGRIEETAAAIAAGDLARRVEEAGPRTEIGRLGTLAERDVGPHRGRLRRAAGVRGTPPTLRGRRVARASHAPDERPRLRRALPPRRGLAAGGPAPCDGTESRPRPTDGVLVDDLLLLATLDQGRAARSPARGPRPARPRAREDARATDPSPPLRCRDRRAVVVERPAAARARSWATSCHVARPHAAGALPARSAMDVADATGVRSRS